MLKHYLVVALRNLTRNKLYSTISVVGLGIGLCGALLAMLVVRNQLTQDQFIAGYEHLYLASTVTRPQAGPVDYSHPTDGRLAALMKARFPAVQSSARLVLEDGGLQKDDNAADESIYWADPQFFDLAPFPVIAGNLATALHRPDGLVLDRRTARRYFGRDNALGETLEVRSATSRGAHTMTVTAVIEDLPAGSTSFQTGIFGSGLAAHSLLAQIDRAPPGDRGSNTAGVLTFARIASDEAIPAIQAGLSPVMNELFKSSDGSTTSLEFVRIDRITQHDGLSPGVASKLALIMLLGFAILLVATVNYINLFTARADQRALEVGIRKVSGATTGVLVWQILFESFVHAVLGALLAVATTEWSLPYVNAFLNTGATFNYWREPELLLVLLAVPFIVALLAGAWPALTLCAFHPGIALSSARRQARGGGARQALVTLQFALLIGLMISAGVVFLQRHFALNQALRLNTDQILMVWAPCRESFLNDLRRIPGVRGFACGGWQWLNEEPNRFTSNARDGSPINLWRVPVDLAVFDLYGLKPVAGRLTLDETGQQYPRDAKHFVINESAARRLGFRTAQEAVGQRIAVPSVVPGSDAGGEQVMAVVPDFSLVSVEKEIKPTVYFFEPSQQYLISVKLAATDIPATLGAIDRAWAATGAKSPTNRFFLDERLEKMYLSMLRQAQAFGVFALVTVLLTAFGLFGLAMASVARRTREIGIRKALGARTADVLRLLLWQFSKPVIWASLIACPLAAWAMQRWLNGFAYHADLPLWLFPAAAFAALLIALGTVTAHSLRVARAKPIRALRYE